MPSPTTMSHSDQINYNPMSGFYNPSGIGSYASTADSKIAPLPVTDVASTYAPPSQVGAPPPPPVPDTGSSPMTDPTTDPGNPDLSGTQIPGFPDSTFDPSGGGGDTTGGSTTGGTGNSAWDQFMSGLTGGQGIFSSLGSMAPYLADYALAQHQADKQSAATNATIAPLMTQATEFTNAAAKDLQLYESGTVNPAQQAMITQYAVSQKAQVAQQLNSQGISDSGALNSAYQQIDNNAMIMKQNFVQQSLSNALSLEGAGIQPLLVAVQDKLLSDTELAKTMMDLSGTLAQAWAYGQSQGKGGGGGSPTAAGAAGGVGSGLLKQGVNTAENYLKGLSSGGGGAPDLTGAGGGTLTDIAAPDTSGLYDLSGIGSDLGLGGDAAATGGTAAATTSATSGLLPGSIAGADMADTAAYTPSIIEATSGADAGGAAAGAGAGAGSAAGAAAAGGIGAAIAYMGLSTAPYRLDASWWSAFNKELTQGVSPNATYNQNTNKYQQMWNAKNSLYSMLKSGMGSDSSVIGGSVGNKMPSGFLTLAKQYGMLNANGTLNTKWNAGPDPSTYMTPQVLDLLEQGKTPDYSTLYDTSRPASGSGGGRPV